MTNKLHINGDNHGNVTNHNSFNIPPRTAVIAALILALILGAAIVTGCWLLRPEKKGQPTPPEERVIQEGPRGGRFYYTRGGNKVYLPKEKTKEPDPGSKEKR